MSAEELVREKQLNVRLSSVELARLERVASYYGLSGPNVLRMLLKREDERLEREESALSASPKPQRRK